MKLLITFLLIISTQISRADLALTCGSTQDCGELAGGLSNAIAAIAVLTGPFFLVNGLGNGLESVHNEEQNFLAVSIGQENLKQLSMQLNASLPRNFVLSTGAAVRIFDKSRPSTVNYSAGAGYKTHLSEWITLTPFLKASVRNYEGYSTTLFSPETGADLFYDYSPHLKFGSGLKAVLGPDPLREVSLSVYTPFHDKYTVNAKSGYLKLSYEEDDFVTSKLYFLSAGLTF